MSGNGTPPRWWMILLLLLVADQKVRSALACRGVDSGLEETEEMQGNFIIIPLFYFHWWVVLNSTTGSIFPSVGV